MVVVKVLECEMNKIYKFTVDIEEETLKFNLGWFGKIYSVETSTVSFDVEEKKLEKMKYELLNSQCVTDWDYVKKEAA